MADVNTEWVVQAHGPLEQLADNLWTVTGVIQMPPGPLPRRMTIARLQNGDLVVFSAVALADKEMADLEALGRPSVLIVPNAFHRLDAGAWKARYPHMQVLTPRKARDGVAQVVPVDQVEGTFADPKVSFITVPGTDEGEGALVVQSGDGATVVVNDLIGNVQGARGLMRLALSAMGFAGRQPQVPRAFSLRMVKDKKATAAQFRSWAELPNLRRIVMSHGDTIHTDAASHLRRLADTLSR